MTDLSKSASPSEPRLPKICDTEFYRNMFDRRIRYEDFPDIIRGLHSSHEVEHPIIHLPETCPSCAYLNAASVWIKHFAAQAAEPRRDEREASILETVDALQTFMQELARSAMLSGDECPDSDRKHFYSEACKLLNHLAWLKEQSGAARADDAPLKQTTHILVESGMHAKACPGCLEEMKKIDVALPQPITLECPKCGWTADEGNFKPIKINPAAQPSAGRIEQLENAIKWALGENGEFAARKDGQGAYWWRTELRKRAMEPSAGQTEEK